MAEVESSFLSQQILKHQEPDDDDDKYDYAYFYGTEDATAQEVIYEEEEDSDGEFIYDEVDSDGEDDMPQQQLEHQRPYYRTNRKLVEEIRQLKAFNSNHRVLLEMKSLKAPPPEPEPEPLPLPPPPSLNVQQLPPLPPLPSSLSSLSIRELATLLDERMTHYFTHCQPSAPGLESQTEALHPVSKKPRLMPA